jgi:endoglucanase
MKGMLVGGVNSALEDDAAKAYLSKSPAAKCYVDNSESYSTNEITIYWNSPLTYLLTLTEDGEGGQTEDFYLGDLNGDKKINVIDLALTKAYISAGFPTQTSKLAADVTQDGTVDGSDAAALQSWIIGKTQKLGDKPKTDPVQGQQGSDNKGTMTASGYLDYGTAPDSSAEKFADFRQGTSPLFFASDGWTNGSVFDCGWYASKAQVANGCLSLTIDKDYSGKYNYAGAEYRTTDFYGYGYYETSMQAIKNPGVVSSFFTYTGPSDNKPWDEIDIEVLGKDTTKVQFNYYTNGSGNHEYMYDLGFDASEGYHTYGFDWQQNKITWYVDGKAVYSATNNIPSTPGKIMMNVWPGTGVDSWLAPFDGKTPLTARYQWVTYTSKNK